MKKRSGNIAFREKVVNQIITALRPSSVLYKICNYILTVKILYRKQSNKISVGLFKNWTI